MKKTKIFFLINSLGTGGSERVVSELASKLSKKAHVKIVQIIQASSYKADVPVIHLSKFKSVAGLLLEDVNKRAFKKLVTSEKPDVVISFLENSNFINILAREELRKSKGHEYKCIISVRANPTYVYKKGLYAQFIKSKISRLYHRADLVITNSRLSRMDLCSNFGVPDEKSRTIYNPVNTSKIAKLAKEKLSKAEQQIFLGKKVVVSVGRLTYLKGQDHLLRAFRLVRQAEKNAMLILVGDGELRSQLEKEVVELGLSGSVYFAGDQSNPFKWVANSQVFAFTSLYEGFPNAILESLACRTSVVSVDCRSGPREMLAKNTNPFNEAEELELAEAGILIPPFGYIKYCKEIERREAILKEAIIKVLNSPSLRRKYAKAGFARVREFESARIADEFYHAMTGVRE